MRPKIAQRPVRIKVDNESSSFFSIIEVFTYDSPGLLFRITDSLYRCDLDIKVAKIATDVEKVVDVFYVCDLYGEKVTSDEHQSRIINSVENALNKINSRE